MEQEHIDCLREMIIEGENVIPKKTFKSEKEYHIEEEVIPVVVKEQNKIQTEEDLFDDIIFKFENRLKEEYYITNEEFDEFKNKFNDYEQCFQLLDIFFEQKNEKEDPFTWDKKQDIIRFLKYYYDGDETMKKYCLKWFQTKYGVYIKTQEKLFILSKQQDNKKLKHLISDGGLITDEQDNIITEDDVPNNLRTIDLKGIKVDFIKQFNIFMEDITGIWEMFDVKNIEKTYELNIRYIEDLISECYNINVFKTFNFKIRNQEKNITDFSPWCITIEDFRLISKSYVFKDKDTMDLMLLSCICQKIEADKTLYVIKSRNFIRVEYKKHTVLEPTSSFIVYDLKDLESFNISYYTIPDKTSKKKKKKNEEEDEEGFKPQTKEAVSVDFKIYVKNNLPLTMLSRTYNDFHRDPKEYFSGKTTRRSLNLFTGFKTKVDKSLSIEECEKHIPKTIKHLKETLCNNNDKDYKYVVQWLARMFLGQKTRTLLLFYSPEGGNGKSYFQMNLTRSVIGNNNSLFVGSQADITNHFNSHLAGKSLIVIDEMKNINDDQFQALKNLITALDSLITGKGKDSKQDSNYINIIMNTNDASKVLTLDTGNNRRFYIIKTNDNVRTDNGYFEELDDEMRKPFWNVYFYNYIIQQLDETFKLDDPSHFNTNGAKESAKDSCLVYDFLSRLYNKEIERDGYNLKINKVVNEISSKGEYESKLFIKKEEIEEGKIWDKKYAVSSSDLFDAFDSLYKNKFQKIGFCKKLSKYSFETSPTEKNEYPTDKMLLYYKKNSLYRFNPNFKPE